MKQAYNTIETFKDVKARAPQRKAPVVMMKAPKAGKSRSTSRRKAEPQAAHVHVEDVDDRDKAQKQKQVKFMEKEDKGKKGTHEHPADTAKPGQPAANPIQKYYEKYILEQIEKEKKKSVFRGGS